MLRIIETFNNLPVCLEVDRDANFQPGQIGSLKISGGKPVVGVCDGLHPCGILDDIKSNVARKAVCNKEYIVAIQYADIVGGHENKTILTRDCRVRLDHSNIIAASFVSSVPGSLRAKDGVFILPKNTICNHRLCNQFDLPCPKSVYYPNDAIRIICSYAYNTPHGEMEDSTIGSGRTTIWNKNMIAETDMFDTSQEYRKYALLYVQSGFLTTKRIDYTCPTIGVVLVEPTTDNPVLRFLLDLEGKVDVGSSSFND